MRTAIAAQLAAMTADLAAPRSAVDAVEIARITSRFLEADSIRERDELGA